MNIAKIEDCYYTEDAIARAFEAERLAYKVGNKELSDAYYFIASLLMDKLERENNDQD